MRVDLPGRLIARWPSRPAFDHIALCAHARLVRHALGASPDEESIALLFHPFFWPYVSHVRPKFVVYYTYDAYSLAPGWTEELARFEEALVRRADLIVAYSQGMLDLLPGDTSRSRKVLPTGVDLEPFESAAGGPCPEDLVPIPRPRIGYVGRINQKLDFALLLQIARQRPDWHWVFVGPIGAYADDRFAADRESELLWLQCCALPNIHTLGEKSHADVPRYLLNMDVNAMCYRTEGKGWWSEIFPLKSLEYLAAGKPIVSSPVRTMLPLDASIAIATNAAEWTGAIEHALVAGGVGSESSRRAVARANTWDIRIDRLSRWITELRSD